MSPALYVALGIVVLTIVVQMAAIRALIGILGKRYQPGAPIKGYWQEVFYLSWAMLVLVIGHVIQIAIWAVVFQLLGEFETFSFAFYHSAVNFTSLGYGDHVMSEAWRVLGPLEAADGILMFGLSAAVFFAVLTRMFTRYTQAKNEAG